MSDKNRINLRTDQLLFSIIMIFILGLLAIIFAANFTLNFVPFILISTLILVILVAFNLGLISGLLFSLAFVFVYGTYILYGILFTGTINELHLGDVIWIFAVPLGAYLAGKLRNEIEHLIWQVEKYSIMDNFITIDEMTGFLNQLGFFKRLEEEVDRSNRFGQPLSVLVIIISNLSEMQAIYGKSGVKELLKAISKVINESTRSIDTKAVINGDTFSIILSETNLEGANALAEKLNRHLERLTIRLNGKKKVIKLRVRIGKAEHKVNEETPMALYDQAMEDTKYDMG